MVETDLISMWGIELDLVLLSRSKLAWFLCQGIKTDLVRESGDRNGLDFSGGSKFNLIFMRGIEVH